MPRPAFAPVLNPVEQMWSWLEHGPLPNVVPDGVPGWDEEFIGRPVELTGDRALLRGL